MLENEVTFYDKDALLYRLHEGLEASDKEVVFVIGAPVTAPFGRRRGVADVAAVVELIRNEFLSKPSQLEKLDAALARSSNVYQAAFDFLNGRAGQDAANRVIRRAVSQALNPGGSTDWTENIWKLTDEQLRALDQDPKPWQFSPAIEALGVLAARYPKRFGGIIITSNFDPLAELAIMRAGGAAWRTSLSVDGSIHHSTAQGCQVIHIHGYWYGTDTLHTNRQLVRSRPTLRNDLLTLLQNKIVVVVAYGGWPDVFTGALEGVVSNDNLFPEILWTFFGEKPALSDHLFKVLRPGIDRNRVTFYQGVDCHVFFPELLGLWENEPQLVSGATGVAVGVEVERRSTVSDRGGLFRLKPLECDRPPNVEIWVGRESELRALETSNAKVVIVCGIGGEGKSALASHYIATLSKREGRYRFWDWRDCKEQSDRIRTQIVEIIVRFSSGQVSADDLKGVGDAELVEVLLDNVRDAHAVLVFDNVDSYVDLENRTFTGILDTLVQRMSASNSSSRVLLTCRPDVQYTASSVITFSMKGISEDEAIELFAKRAPTQSVPEDDIRAAHQLTNGHAFWLDLLAVQVTKVPGATLPKLFQDMRRGREDVPDVLSSIWDKLALREKTLLRFMAEAVRPETEKTIERFVASQLSYKNFSRALKSLISLNLIVVKPETDAPDLYDLHPLVRQFVRTKFPLAERADFIRVVINQYEVIIGAIEAMLGSHLPFAMLERWSQKAELEVSAGLYEAAFATLAKVEDAFIGGGHVQEYVRVGRLLFESIDWETAAARYVEFDKIVGVMVAAFDQLGEHQAADVMLARYEATIPQKTARYINFCDIRAFSFWTRGEFEPAIEWAGKGVTLKNESNVDTAFDCEHNLALALRDAGQPEVALATFLQGRELSAILNLEDDADANGTVFGNVGRCLHLMGRLQEALICYKRSMILLERDSSSFSRSNRAYARLWIGQVFAEIGDAGKAEAFLMDAITVLGKSSPVRVRDIYTKLDRVRDKASSIMDEARSARIVMNWMND